MLEKLKLAFYLMFGFPYYLSDTDECKDSNPCPIGTCINLLGNYSCKCPEGYKNDVMDEKKCIEDNNSSKIILPLVISLGMPLNLHGNMHHKIIA